MAKPFIRKGIPNKSVLTITVSGEGADDDQKFTVEGKLEHSDGSEDTWDDQDLRKGITEVLKSPDICTGQIDINFAANSTARIQMTVTKPNGTKHVYDETASRTSGLDRTTLLLVLQKKA